MAITYINWTGEEENSAGTTLDGAVVLNIAAGDFLIGFCKWETSTSTIALSDGGSNGFTMFAVVKHATSNMWISIGYKLAATANATATITMTTGSSVGYRAFGVLQFRPDAEETVSLDAGPSTGQGTTAAIQSGDINTAGTDEVIFAGTGTYSANTPASPLIADAAADGGDGANNNYSYTWYKIFTGAQTGVHAQVTASGAMSWICDVLAFKSVAAGGGTIVPPAMNYYRRLRNN